MKARNSFAVIGKICKSSKDEPKELLFKKKPRIRQTAVFACLHFNMYVGVLGFVLSV